MGWKLEWDVERELGVSPGRGAAGPGRRLMRESQDKAVSHYWGLVWGNHTPRGWWCALGSSSSSSSGCRRRRSSHSQAWERRQLRQGRGLGPWKEALQGQGLAGPRGTVPGWARAWELDQGRARTALLVAPSHYPQGRPHLCPHCSKRQQRRGWGYQTPELLPPSAELPEFSSFSGSLSPPL